MRAALGAGRAGIVRQLLVESLVVACAAGVLGMLLAAGALEAILALVPPDTIPDESEVALNMPVLSVHARRVRRDERDLRPGARASRHVGDVVVVVARERPQRHGRTPARLFRKSLVVAEVALSLMLLVGAGLMIRTFLAVDRVDLGFRTDRVLTLRVPLPDRRYPDRSDGPRSSRS